MCGIIGFNLSKQADVPENSTNPIYLYSVTAGHKESPNES